MSGLLSSLVPPSIWGRQQSFFDGLSQGRRGVGTAKIEWFNGIVQFDSVAVFLVLVKLYVVLGVFLL